MLQVGKTKDEIITLLYNLKSNDIKWKEGKAFSLIYNPNNNNVLEIGNIAYSAYISENALNPSAFPSLQKMEQQVISMLANLLNGNQQTAGNLTTGGTKSILLAVKTAREWAKKHKNITENVNIIIPETAHPAFLKACHYFNVEPKVISINANGAANTELITQNINSKTAMIVASAPSYPHGIIDPVAEIANIALKNNILCHVDACVGGMILPFLQQLGEPIPSFDFSNEGVTSMSVDIHKYGYAPKGVSAILYRSRELRKHQFFISTNWKGGIYASPTTTGTRAGGAIAAAWAVMNFLGKNGYLELTTQVINATQMLKKAITLYPDLQIINQPLASILAISSNTLNVFTIADELGLKGWHIDRQQNPASLHFTISPIHLVTMPNFLLDLEAAVKTARNLNLQNIGQKLQVSILKTAKKILPKGSIAKLQNYLPKSDLSQQKRSAAMYGMLGELLGTDDLDTMVLQILDELNSL